MENQGRETVSFLEVDQPFCDKVFGVTCAGHLAATGVRKCFNTRSTCHDPANFNQAAYLSLPGVGGNYASTPDSAALDIVGDLDLRAKAAAADWTPAAVSTLLAKWTAGQRSYSLKINTDGKLILEWTTDGSTPITKSSTAATGVADGATKWARATLDVNNGASGNDVKFYLSDDGVNWTQLGTTVTTAGVTSVFSGTANLELGSNSGGATEVFSGKVFYAEARNGIDGVPVARFDPARGERTGDLTLIARSGETWTVAQSGSPAASLVTGFIRLRFAEQQDGLLEYGNVLPALLGEPRTSAATVNLGGLDRNLAAFGKREELSAALEDFQHSDLIVDPYRLERPDGRAAQKHLALPGGLGNYASTPDSAAASVTGDIDIRVRAMANDWTPSVLKDLIDKSTGDASQFSYLLRLHADGTLQLYWSANGTTTLSASSTVATGIQDGADKWLRATLDVDNGASGRDVKFYTSVDYNPGDGSGTWTQLGTTVTQAGVTSIFDGTATLKVGQRGGSGASDPWAGKVWHAEVRNGIGGAVVARFDPNAANAADGAAFFVSGTGEAWTVNGTARITAYEKYTPETSGTFWGKWAARNAYFANYPCRVRDGFMGDALTVMRAREYLLNKFEGPSGGEVQITARDLFSKVDAKKAVAPLPSEGELSANIAASGVTTFTLNPAGIGNLDYPTSGHVSVGSEIIEFTRSGDVMTVVARGALGTMAAAHDDDDLVQLVTSYVGKKAVDIFYDLLANYTEIDPAALPKWTWDVVAAALTEVYTGRVAKPTPVQDLVGELMEQAAVTLYPDVETNEIVLVPLRASEISTEVNDDAWVKDDTLQTQRQDVRRVSQVWVHYGMKDPTADLDDAANFHSRVVVADLPAEGPDQHGTPLIRNVFSRWIAQFGRTAAEFVGNRIVTMFRDPPVEAKFTLHASRRGRLSLAKLFYLRTADVQDEVGQPLLAAHAVTSIKNSANELDVTSQAVKFVPQAGESPSAEKIIPIENNAYNLNLRTIYDTLYSPPIGVEVVTFEVLQNVEVGSTSTGTYAIRTGTWPAGVTLKLVNKGRIQGKGGKGAEGYTDSPGAGSFGVNGLPGELGGSALLVEAPISIDNASGKLWAGAGGGGSGAAENNGCNNCGCQRGAAGGGGAGLDPGIGGNSTNFPPCFSLSDGRGQVGTKDTGGTRGFGHASQVTADGGDGGGPGLPGNNGSGGFGFVGGTGGAAGKYVQGNSLVTWIATGDVRGNVA